MELQRDIVMRRGKVDEIEVMRRLGRSESVVLILDPVYVVWVLSNESLMIGSGTGSLSLSRLRVRLPN